MQLYTFTALVTRGNTSAVKKTARISGVSAVAACARYRYLLQSTGHRVDNILHVRA